MRRQPFTNRTAQELARQHQGIEAPIEVYDAALRGFGLRVSPSGALTWFLRVREKATGRKVHQAIGRADAMSGEAVTYEAALEVAVTARKKMRDGRRDAGDRPAIRTVGELCDAYYAEHCAKKDSADSDKVRLENCVKPLLGAVLLAHLTRAHVDKALRKIAAVGTPVAAKRREDAGEAPRPAPRLANKIHELVRAMLRWAARQDPPIIERLPILGERPSPGKGKKHAILTDAELRRYWAALAEEEAESPDYVAAIRLMLLIGARVGDVARMERPHVEREPGVWNCPEESVKTDEVYRYPLPAEARAIVDAMLARYPGSRFVFPPARSSGDWKDVRCAVERCMQRMRERAGIKTRFTPHGCRHQFRTGLARLGVSGERARRCMQHKDPSITAAYDHYAYDAERLEDFGKWETALLALVGMEPVPPSGELPLNVVRLRPAA